MPEDDANDRRADALSVGRDAEPSAAFTPGPLSYSDGSLDMGPGDPGHAHPWEVYVPRKQTTAYCRREADARLYAAAPDLLGVAQNGVSLCLALIAQAEVQGWPLTSGHVIRRDLERFRAAIAKATGKESS